MPQIFSLYVKWQSISIKLITGDCIKWDYSWKNLDFVFLYLNIIMLKIMWWVANFLVVFYEIKLNYVIQIVIAPHKVIWTVAISFFAVLKMHKKYWKFLRWWKTKQPVTFSPKINMLLICCSCFRGILGTPTRTFFFVIQYPFWCILTYSVF